MEVINKIGRRKCAVARIYMTLGNGNITINGKDYTCFSLEYRTDKSAIFFRSDRRNIIKLLCEYNIDILNKYQLKK